MSKLVKRKEKSKDSVSTPDPRDQSANGEDNDERLESPEDMAVDDLVENDDDGGDDIDTSMAAEGTANGSRLDHDEDDPWETNGYLSIDAIEAANHLAVH